MTALKFHLRLKTKIQDKSRLLTRSHHIQCRNTKCSKCNLNFINFKKLTPKLLDSLWLWTIVGAKYSTMKYWSFVKSLFSKVIQLILRHYALRHVYDFTTLWWIITSFSTNRRKPEEDKQLSRVKFVCVSMCVCVTCGQNAPRGKTSHGKNSNLITIYDFAFAVFWGVKWPAFLPSVISSS